MEKTEIDHIAIVVNNIEEAKKWYLEHLQNGKVTFCDENQCRIKVSNTNITLITEGKGKKPHIGVLCDDLKDLPINELENHREHTISSYLEDPDGNIVEFIHYWGPDKEIFLG